MNEYFKPTEIWYAFFGAFIALAIAAIEIRLERRKRRRFVKKGLETSLNRNRQLVQQAIRQIRSGDFPTYPLDHVGLSEWNSRAIEIFSENFYVRVDGLRFEMVHISETILSATPEEILNNLKRQAVETHLLNVEIWILETLLEAQKKQSLQK